MVKFSSPTHPLVGIGVVVWREQQVLLVRRKNPPLAGQWGLPGGKQQWGETIFDAAQRETREETGIEITPLGIITALDAITRDGENKIEYHYTIVEVAAEYQSGEAKADDDALDTRWADLEEVGNLCSWPEVARVVRLSMLQRIL
jgi:ADP-ribose pyrophosphatase YjhB (NUDIX family)